MIPAVEQIVADLLAGSITKEQAIKWLNEHIEMAYRQGYDDSFLKYP